MYGLAGQPGSGSPVVPAAGSPQPSAARRQWPLWTIPVAGIWSLLYGGLGLFWVLGGAGFPFGEHDPGAIASILGRARIDVAAPLIVVLGLLGASVAAAMSWGAGRGIVRAALLGLAWVAAVALTLVIPDYRALAAVAYMPIFLVGAPFGWPSVRFFDVIPWPVLNQLVCVSGGLAWSAAAIVYGRRTRGACVYCGRAADGAGWAGSAMAARWGKVAVAVAIAVPLVYAATRWAWALGIPLGVSTAFLRENDRETPGIWLAGAALGTIGAGGAVLTLGLVQRWGEVFPRWLVPLAGRRVPPALAIVPAAIVAVLVTEAGLMYIRIALQGAFPAGNGATYAPELLWPIWGIALGVATRAYYLRRRGRCARCGYS